MKQKKTFKWYTIVAGVGALLLALPICVFMYIQDFFENKKRNKCALHHIRPGKQYDNMPLMPYQEPNAPVDDSEFLSRIDEFICFQFERWNGLSGNGYAYQFFASESPELKEYVLRFLEKHPIKDLLYGDIDCNAHDMDDWEMRIIFEDQSLNRCIRGCGITEASAPFLRELVPYLVHNQNRD